MDSLTPQKQLVLDQTQRLFDNVDRTGEHLDSKATTVLQAGALIVALTSATTLPSLVTNQAEPWVIFGAAMGFIAFIAMTIFAVLAWHPNDHKQAGTANWNNYFDMYLNQEPDDAYKQVLYNLTRAIEANQATNRIKVRYITYASVLLVLQVVGILVIALASAL